MKKILTKTRNKHQSEKYWNMIDKCCFVYLYTKHESLKHIESSENRYFWFPNFFLGKLYALSFFSFFLFEFVSISLFCIFGSTGGCLRKFPKQPVEYFWSASQQKLSFVFIFRSISSLRNKGTTQKVWLLTVTFLRTFVWKLSNKHERVSWLPVEIH